MTIKLRVIFGAFFGLGALFRNKSNRPPLLLSWFNILTPTRATFMPLKNHLSLLYGRAPTFHFYNGCLLVKLSEPTKLFRFRLANLGRGRILVRRTTNLFSYDQGLISC